MSSQLQSQVHGGEIKCTSCGAAQTPESIGRGACQYCNAVLPHRVAAAKQAEAVKQMMADVNGNGIPDMFEPQVANMQRNMQVNVGYGPAGGVVVATAFGSGPGGVVHQYNAPPMHPYAMNNHVEGVARATSAAMVVVFVMLGLGLLLALGGAGAAFYFLSGGG